MVTRDRPNAHRPAEMEGAAARSRRREERTQGGPWARVRMADNHTVRNSSPVAGSPPT